jgi:sigma-B regulation protein RsbU (phosphoserine phosphatase)
MTTQGRSAARPTPKGTAPKATASAFLRAVAPSPAKEHELLHGILHDYIAAAQFQSRILQRKPPAIPTLDLAAYSSPASHLSGDFHDFIRWGDSHLGIVIGDAMGKGLAASLLMMQTRAVVRSLATVTRSPEILVRNANRILAPDLGRGIFVTLQVAVLDLQTGEIRVANAGHPPMLVWHPETGRCSELSIGGFALGVANESLFDRSIRESTVRLEPGARIVFYSDGVTELQDRQQAEFGKGRLVRQILSHSASASCEFLDGVITELEIHRSGIAPSDDLTLVTGLARSATGSGSAS